MKHSFLLLLKLNIDSCHNPWPASLHHCLDVMCKRTTMEISPGLYCVLILDYIFDAFCFYVLRLNYIKKKKKSNHSPSDNVNLHLALFLSMHFHLILFFVDVSLNSGSVCHSRISQEERIHRCLSQSLWNVSPNVLP